jgi:hypothetical protein
MTRSSHPVSLVIAGDAPLYRDALQRLARTTALVPLREAPLPLAESAFRQPGVQGALYVCAGRGPCADVLGSLYRGWRSTGLPQLVLCEQLGGLFAQLPGVTVLPLNAPLADIRAAIVRLTAPGAARPCRYTPLPYLTLPQRELLRWRELGVSMPRIAGHMRLPLKRVYARHAALMTALGIHTLPERAALYRMSESVLRIWHGGTGRDEVPGRRPVPPINERAEHGTSTRNTLIQPTGRHRLP